MRVDRREATVVAPPIDRARVADPWFARDRGLFVEVEADYDVRCAAATAMLGLNETHRKSPRDRTISVADEDRAELGATLQTRDCGLDRRRVTVPNEQIVATGVGGHHDAACGYRPRAKITRRWVLLRLGADVARGVLAAGMQTRATRQE